MNLELFNLAAGFGLGTAFGVWTGFGLGTAFGLWAGFRLWRITCVRRS